MQLDASPRAWYVTFWIVMGTGHFLLTGMCLYVLWQIRNELKRG